MREIDLKIEVINPRPPGGQHVGVEPQYVKITHKPTGLYAACIYERSQHKNKVIAERMLEYGLAELGWQDVPLVEQKENGQ